MAKVDISLRLQHAIDFSFCLFVSILVMALLAFRRSLMEPLDLTILIGIGIDRIDKRRIVDYLTCTRN